MTWQAAAFGVVCAGLMSMFVVGRHTRAEEESGRDELLRAAPVGRYAARLQWSDGHDAGIYSWDYLLEMRREQEEASGQKLS